MTASMLATEVLLRSVWVEHVEATGAYPRSPYPCDDRPAPGSRHAVSALPVQPAGRSGGAGAPRAAAGRRPSQARSASSPAAAHGHRGEQRLAQDLLRGVRRLAERSAAPRRLGGRPASDVPTPPAAATRPSSLAASASAGMRQRDPVDGRRRGPSRRALSRLPVRLDLVGGRAPRRRRRRAGAAGPAWSTIPSATSSIDHGALGVAPGRSGRGRPPAAAGRRAPRAASASVAGLDRLDGLVGLLEQVRSPASRGSARRPTGSRPASAAGPSPRPGRAAAPRVAAGAGPAPSASGAPAPSIGGDSVVGGGRHGRPAGCRRTGRSGG